MSLPLVVGVDGTEFSLRAVDWAVDEAARGPYTVRLVHAVEESEELKELKESEEEDYGPSGTARPGADRAPGERVLAAAAERAAARAPRVPVRTRLLEDAPLPALLQEGRQAAMVVVGCRGQGQVAGMLLGSVGLGVAARASCPVVVVRGGGPGGAERAHRVTLGVSGAWQDAAAVRFAFRVAERRGCELRAVHCRRGPTGRGRKPEEVLDEALRGDAAMHPDVVVCREAVPEPPRHALLRRSTDSDLLVVGARRQRGHPGLQLGLLGHAVLHHAECPVAVVPRPSP